MQLRYLWYLWISTTEASARVQEDDVVEARAECTHRMYICMRLAPDCTVHDKQLPQWTAMDADMAVGYSGVNYIEGSSTL